MSGASGEPARPARLLGPIVAVLSAGLVLLGLELALRVLGIGDPLTRRDPFEGFAGTPSAFVVADESGGARRYVVRPAKRELLGELELVVPKPPGTFRVLCFGGSVVRGVPAGPQGAFCRILGDALQTGRPTLRVETVNLGVSGFGSLRVLELVREAAAYDPDLFVIYLGQNEFRDARFHPDRLRRGALEVELRRWLFASRAVAWLEERRGALVARLRGARITSYGAEQITRVLDEGRFRAAPAWRVPEVVPGPAPEPRAEPPVDGSPANVLRTLARRLAGRPAYDEEVYAAFDASLEAMLAVAREAGVPVLLPVQAWNARETSRLTTPPVPAAALQPGAADRFRTRYADGVAAAQAGRCDEALVAFDEVAALYAPGRAGDDLLLGLYRGECQLRVGRLDDARATFAARVPRSQRRLEAMVREAAAAHGLASLDVEALLSARSADGIPGYDDFFYDNVHLTTRANREIGLALAEVVEAKGWIAPAADAGPPPEPVLTPNADFAIARGWSAFHRGHDAEAEGLAREALARAPAEPQALLLLGYALESQGRDEEARATLERLRTAWAQLGARS